MYYQLGFHSSHPVTSRLQDHDHTLVSLVAFLRQKLKQMESQATIDGL